MNSTQQPQLKLQLKSLESLQEIDLKIDQLNKQKQEIPQALKSVSDALQKAQALVQLRTKSIEELEKAERQTRAALDLNADRLTRSTGKMDAVKNTNEFQAASKEIEQLRKLNATLTEQLKKSGEDLAQAKKDLAESESAAAKAKEEYDSKASEAEGQKSKLDQEIQSLVGQRAQFTSGVEARILSQYDRIRGARGGLGIVPAVGGRCKGCNMMVPPQLFNEIQRADALHQCPSCYRLLFAPS